jgi:hypothetical protein
MSWAAGREVDTHQRIVTRLLHVEWPSIRSLEVTVVLGERLRLE